MSAAIGVQLAVVVGPVLLSEHVVVVNELPEFGSEGTQLATGTLFVTVGVQVVD